jgi:hypothetical protein
MPSRYMENVSVSKGAGAWKTVAGPVGASQSRYPATDGPPWCGSVGLRGVVRRKSRSPLLPQ